MSIDRYVDKYMTIVLHGNIDKSIGRDITFYEHVQIVPRD